MYLLPLYTFLSSSISAWFPDFKPNLIACRCVTGTYSMIYPVNRTSSLLLSSFTSSHPQIQYPDTNFPSSLVPILDSSALQHFVFWSRQFCPLSFSQLRYVGSTSEFLCILAMICTVQYMCLFTNPVYIYTRYPFLSFLVHFVWSV